MPLPRKYSTQEDIPEALREHFRQASDGSWELDLEGGLPLGAPGERALQREKEERRQATEALRALQEKFGDLDPEKAREALSQINQLEEEKLRSEKKFEELAERKFQGQIRQLQQQIQALTDAVKYEQGRVTAARDRFAQVAINDQLGKIALELGVDPKKLKFLVQEARPLWRLNDQDQPQPMEQDEQGEWRTVYGAQAGQPISMKEQLQGLVKENPFFLLETSGAGTQQRGFGGGGNGMPFTITRQEARNINLFQQRQEAARQAGSELAIVDQP